MEKVDQETERCNRNINILIGFFIALVLIVGFSIITSATALNITFADSTLTGNHSIDVISGNGSLLNTSWSGDTVTLALEDAENDTIIIHYLPASTGGNRFLDRFTSTLDTPDLMIESFTDYVAAYWVPLLVIGFLFSLFIWRR